MEYIILVLIKIFDNVLGTTKTILTQKGKAFYAALTVTISQFIFFTIISSVVSSDNSLKMVLVSISGGIGTFVAIKFNEKFSKDKMYVHTISSKDKDSMMDFSNYLKDKKIKNVISDSYTKDWEKTLAITVFAETKAESRLIDQYMESSEAPFFRMINK